MSRSFNRTFMELKLRYCRRLSWHSLGFNRTFMELKLYRGTKPRTESVVLIVPLWN